MPQEEISAVSVSEVTETVTIETENGPVRINKADFDPDTHTLADGVAVTRSLKKAGKEKGKPAPSEQPPELT